MFSIEDEISRIARIAGSKIMKIYMSNSYFSINVKNKLDRSPITNADLVANEIIMHFLSKLDPNIPIISEENIPEWEECKKWNYFWLIDPLDGTKEFLSRNGEFTVNIALIKYGNPILGVIYVPVHNILYIANTRRSWKINATGEKELLSISVKNIFSQNLIVVMSRSHIYDFEKKILCNYLMNTKNYKIINIGSSFKFCLIAEGLAQFYLRFSPTKIWDTAAGHIIAKSAGAVINDWCDNPLNYKIIHNFFLNPGFYVHGMNQY